MSQFTQEDINEINQAIFDECRSVLSRRGLLVRGAAISAGGMIAVNMVGCGRGPSASEFSNNAANPVAAALKATGFPHFDYYKDQDAVDAYFPKLMASQLGRNNPKAAMKIFGGMIGGVIKFWLDKYPYEGVPGKFDGFFPQLFAQRKTRGISQSKVAIPIPDPRNPGQTIKVIPWPIVVFQNEHVLAGLKNSSTFTVDPYSLNMEIATSGSQYPLKMDPVTKAYQTRPKLLSSDKTKVKPKSGYYQHYMLGTDNDDAYQADSILSRIAMRKSDIKFLSREIRKTCEEIVSKTHKPGKDYDVVKNICRLSPVMVVQNHVGLPSSGPFSGNPQFNIDNLKAGDTFKIPKELKERYKFQKVTRNSDMDFKPIDGTKGIVPSHTDMYQWVKAAFRNIFNNFGNPKDPKVASVRLAGLAATQNLLAWSSYVIEHYQKLIKSGEKLGSASVPITMITRLIEMQQMVQTKAGYKKLVRMHPEVGGIGYEETQRRLTTDRIQVLAFGVFVGAVANPEEANARIIDGVMRLREDRIKSSTPNNGNINSYKHAKELAKSTSSADEETLHNYALELLRLQPQGEILLRRAVKPSKIDNFVVPPNTTVFFAHGAAMRDDKASRLKDPLKFNAYRQKGIDKKTEELKYSDGIDARKREASQSRIYLQHGYGRHKCLGRYASEITMRECLRAVLNLGDLSRKSELKMDAAGLYADSMVVKIN